MQTGAPEPLRKTVDALIEGRIPVGFAAFLVREEIFFGNGGKPTVSGFPAPAEALWLARPQVGLGKRLGFNQEPS